MGDSAAGGDSVHWSRTLSGTFVGGAADVCGQGGGASPEFNSLRELMARQAEDFTRSKIRQDQEREADEREQRLRAQAARVGADLGLPPDLAELDAPLKRQRGKPQPVVCLTRVNPGTGKLWGASGEFPTVSRAGHWVSQKADNVCQAIKRGGTCGGERWAYLKDLTADQLQAATADAVRERGTGGQPVAPPCKGVVRASAGRMLARAVSRPRGARQPRPKGRSAAMRRLGGGLVTAA